SRVQAPNLKDDQAADEQQGIAQQAGQAVLGRYFQAQGPQQVRPEQPGDRGDADPEGAESDRQHDQIRGGESLLLDREQGPGEACGEQLDGLPAYLAESRETVDRIRSRNQPKPPLDRQQGQLQTALPNQVNP